MVITFVLLYFPKALTKGEGNFYPFQLLEGKFYPFNISMTNPTLETIADRIIAVRSSTGLNQAEFARTVPYDVSNYRKIEKGALKPNQDVLKALSSKYKINLDWLLTGHGDMSKPGTSEGFHWLGLRLAELEQENGISGRKLALSVAFSPSHYGAAKTGKRGLPKEKALAIAEKYNVPVEWLISEKASRGYANEARQVPLSDYVEVSCLKIESQAGFIGAAGSQEYIQTLPKRLVPKKSVRKNSIIMEVKGDSMDDGTADAIRENDEYMCHPFTWDKKNGPLDRVDAIFMIVHRDGAMACKEIVDHNVRSGLIRCHSWNPIYEDYSVFLEDVIALYEVGDLVHRAVRGRKKKNHK